MNISAKMPSPSQSPPIVSVRASWDLPDDFHGDQRLQATPSGVDVQGTFRRTALHEAAGAQLGAAVLAKANGANDVLAHTSSDGGLHVVVGSAAAATTPKLSTHTWQLIIDREGTDHDQIMSGDYWDSNHSASVPEKIVRAARIAADAARAHDPLAAAPDAVQLIAEL